LNLAHGNAKSFFWRFRVPDSNFFRFLQQQREAQHGTIDTFVISYVHRSDSLEFNWIFGQFIIRSNSRHSKTFLAARSSS